MVATQIFFISGMEKKPRQIGEDWFPIWLVHIFQMGWWKTTNPKQSFINGCFNWMIPNLYIGNGWLFHQTSIYKWLFGVPGNRMFSCSTGDPFGEKRFDLKLGSPIFAVPSPWQMLRTTFVFRGSRCFHGNLRYLVPPPQYIAGLIKGLINHWFSLRFPWFFFC